MGIVVSSLNGGGAERQAALWAEMSRSSGHAVTVLALLSLPDEFELPAGVERRYADKRGALGLARPLTAILRLAREVDVIVAFQPYCAMLCMPARGLAPVVAVTGEDPRQFGDTSRVPKRALRAGLAAASLRTAPTQGLIDCHRASGIAASRDWLCVPNAVDSAAFSAVSSRRRRGALFVGRLVPEKDPALAIDVAHAAGVPLTMMGEGPLRAELEARARAAGAEVAFTGYVSKPWPAYADHAVCLVTSRYEAFGNMLVESLAAGTPVVAGDCDFGPREVLADARFSRVVARDRDPLAEALAEAVGERDAGAVEADSRRIAERYEVASLAPAVDRALALARGWAA